MSGKPTHALRADPIVVTQTTRGIRANYAVSVMIDNVGTVDATLRFNGKAVTLAAGSQPLILTQGQNCEPRSDIFDIEISAPLGSTPEVHVWRDFLVEIPKGSIVP